MDARSVPNGVAHGFRIIEDDAEIFYQVTEFYNVRDAFYPDFSGSA